MSDRVLALLVGSFVIVAAVIVLAGTGPRRTMPVLVAAGSATAFTGVTTGLPGPPMSIVFHDADPPVMRSTSSLFVAAFIVVAAVSLLAVGEYGTRELELTLLLLPSVIVGLGAARYLRPWIDATIFRPVILVLAAGGGLALLLRNL